MEGRGPSTEDPSGPKRAYEESITSHYWFPPLRGSFLHFLDTLNGVNPTDSIEENLYGIS